MEIKGSVIIANCGLGKAFTDVLIGAGAAKVYAGAPDPAAIANTNERLIPLPLDVTRDADVTAAATACPGVNLVINNAGIMKASPFLAEGAEAAFRAEMEVNVFGCSAWCVLSCPFSRGTAAAPS